MVERQVVCGSVKESPRIDDFIFLGIGHEIGKDIMKQVLGAFRRTGYAVQKNQKFPGMGMVQPDDFFFIDQLFLA
jgi:hypothetical protein